MLMNNEIEQKKEYVTPLVEVYHLLTQGNVLLDDSPNPNTTTENLCEGDKCRTDMIIEP